VLWSPKEDWLDFGEPLLRQRRFRRLAIANPRFAPFGLAAKQALESLGIWDSLQGNLVRGENVGQAFHFVSSRNADLGFISLSQIIDFESARIEGSHWIVPETLYQPIRQQALLLTETPSARDFLAFLTSNQGRAIIEQFGYGLP
jgi:molybdate transport system substrate-binding protein